MRLFGLILTILLTLTSVPMRAQSERDSIDTHEWAAKVTGEEGQLQPRYLPKGDSTAQSYIKGLHWYNRFRVGLGTAYAGQHNKEQNSYSIPVNATLAYQFSPVHALQGKLSYAELHRKSGPTLRSASMELDYFVNFTNYSRGFSVKRIATFSGFIGIGGRLNTNTDIGVREKSPYGVLGADVTINLGNNVGISLQPYLGVIRDQPYLYKKKNNTFYEFMYGINANVQLDFMPKRFEGRDLTASTFFVEASQGVTLPLNSSQGLANDKTLNKSATVSVGSAYTFAFGYWPTKIVGMRLAMHAQDYFCNSTEVPAKIVSGQQVNAPYTTRERGSFVGGRLEMLFAPFNVSEKWRNNKHFDINLSGGMEMGKFGEAGQGLLIRYLGATMGAQVLYKLPKTDNAMLFVEPRYTWMFYNVPYSNANKKKGYKEHFAMISAGVRLSRDIRGKHETTDSTQVAKEKYKEPGRFFSSIAWGDMRTFSRSITYSGKHKFNNSVVGTFGRTFNSWVTTLLQIDYAQKHTASYQPYDVTVGTGIKRYSGMWDINYHSLSIRLMYQLRLNNLMGYHHTRQRFQLSVLTGPVFCANIKGKRQLSKGEMPGGTNPHLVNHITGTRGSMSWAGALQARYFIKDNWSIFVEPMGQFNTGKYFERIYIYDHIGATYSF